MALLRLRLETELEGGVSRLRFWHGREPLCTLVHAAVYPLPEAVPEPYGAMRALGHGLMNGVRGLVPLCGFWSIRENGNSIRFDACEGVWRRAAMVLVGADGQGGKVFRITWENYEELLGQMRAWAQAVVAEAAEMRPEKMFPEAAGQVDSLAARLVREAVGETRLAVQVWVDDGGMCRLRFEKGRSRTAMFLLCVLEHPAVQPLPEAVPEPLPAMSAWYFRLFHGVRGLVPLLGFWSTLESRNSIRFEACRDRHGREMVLVTTSHRYLAGEVFAITRENYEEVLAVVRSWGEALANGEVPS